MDLKMMIGNGQIKLERFGNGYELLFPGTLFYTRVFDDEKRLSFNTIGSEYDTVKLKEHLDNGYKYLPLFEFLEGKGHLFSELQELTLDREEQNRVTNYLLQEIEKRVKPVTGTIPFNAVKEMSKAGQKVYAFNGYQFLLASSGQEVLRVECLNNTVKIDDEKYDLFGVLKGNESHIIQEFMDRLDRYLDGSVVWSDNNGTV